MTLAVTLTVEQLRAIVREELQAAIREMERPTALPSDDDVSTADRLAKARKRWAQKMGHK